MGAKVEGMQSVGGRQNFPHCFVSNLVESCGEKRIWRKRKKALYLCNPFAQTKKQRFSWDFFTKDLVG